MPVHRRVRIQMDGALARRKLPNGAHVLARVHTRELVVGGERRFMALEMIGEAGSDQLIFDRGETLGPLRMMRAHVMPEAIGMRYQGARHDIFIISHRLQSPHAPQESRNRVAERPLRPDRASDRGGRRQHSRPGAAGPAPAPPPPPPGALSVLGSPPAPPKPPRALRPRRPP